MPVQDAGQLVRSAVERNKGIPAILDAYGEFVDSPMGPLELQNLGEVFSRILDNLSQRFPEIAAKRAASTSQSDIASFLVAASNDVERTKHALANELRTVSRSIMVPSIAERFSRMNSEERRAIDATLRLIRRSQVEILFRADAGKSLSSSGRDYERFFAAVRSESPTIRELRYENLIVEKAIFNKLFLKSKDRAYSIWVPSFFVREDADSLIEKAAVSSEHLMRLRLKELPPTKLESLKGGFFAQLTQNLGVLPKSQAIPEEFSDFVKPVDDYLILPPSDLDDVVSFFAEQAELAEKARAAELETMRLQEEVRRSEQERKSEQVRQRMRQVTIEVPTTQAKPKQEREGPQEDSVYLGKQLDMDQLVGAINRRVPEKDIPAQVNQTGEYYLRYDRKNVAIIGSSGSGKSVTLNRLLDGLASKKPAPRIMVIDQKGEHRGIAWKYGWKVYAFVGDSQAQEFRVSLFSGEDEAYASTAADLLQEWFDQSGLNCTDQQRERIASLIRAQSKENLNLEKVSNLLGNEQDLSGFGQRLRKSLVMKSGFPKIFSEEKSSAFNLPVDGGILFDTSGRGLKDPTTREDRQIISVILLRNLSRTGLRNSIIVIEDTLDRFKSEALKRGTVEVIGELASDGNCIISTSRSQVRDFFSNNQTLELVELVHRISGEKVISEEFVNFGSGGISNQILARIVAYLPRGYLIASANGNAVSQRAGAVRVEPLQFTSTIQ